MNKGTKSLEHGSIGETRTKELLIDRFFILERSLDDEGADFIIQKRLSSLTGIEPARLGIVQAKYRENVNSEIELKEEYVIGDKETKHEFFLLIHTGKEDSKEKFFLTAEQISKFPLKSGTYRISSLKGSSYKEISNTNILNKIENCMKEVEFINNQKFVQRYLSGALNEREKLKEDYYMHLIESDENFIKATRVFKEQLGKKVSEVVKQLDVVTQIIKSDDPSEIIGQLNDLGEIKYLDVESMKLILDELNGLARGFNHHKENIKRYKERLEGLNENTKSKIISFKYEMEKKLLSQIKVGNRSNKIYYSKVAVEPKRTKVDLNIYQTGEYTGEPFIAKYERSECGCFYFFFTWAIHNQHDDYWNVSNITECIFESIIPKFVDFLA
ncbi:hypothetical protein [Halobacillus litoralis]|uniref:hypothetical protein n=1 Tax=Halobacillus litoralis TaxID=45668 RepID=UPI001CFD4906|nr:hypothetical protein [Halobacillus litoralis]